MPIFSTIKLYRKVIDTGVRLMYNQGEGCISSSGGLLYEQEVDHIFNFKFMRYSALCQRDRDIFKRGQNHRRYYPALLRLRVFKSWHIFDKAG